MSEIRSMHWTHTAWPPTLARERSTTMLSDEFLASEILGHGAYLCLRHAGGGDVRSAGAARIATLAQHLGLQNEFDPGGKPPRESIAYLRRHDATPADIADDDLLRAEAVIHVASARGEVVAELCSEAARLLGPV